MKRWMTMVTALTLLLVTASTVLGQTRTRRGEAAETPPNPRGATQATDPDVDRPELEVIPRGLDRPDLPQR